MKTNTRENIYIYILENAPVSVSMIAKHFGLSTQIIHRHILRLFNEGKIYKVGKPPRVFYFAEDLEGEFEYGISLEKQSILQKNFLLFTPDGAMLEGVKAFYEWCKNRGLDFEKEVDIYIRTIKKYDAYKNDEGFIDGIKKLEDTFAFVYLDKVYYLDFYSIEKYGKTMLGNLMFYGKQTGDREIINKILEKISEPINEFILKHNIDAVAYIPPSIDRKIQLMDEIKKGLNLKLPELKLFKIFKDKVVPQKSLGSKDDRIINARTTIYIENRDFVASRILLIDDAVGSGATLNELAKKIKDMSIASYVVGVAIVGSIKGFEVIREV